jgi:sulfite exporter TauE/SafE
MSTTLAATALLMGLAGGPHCAAMCGAACAGIIRVVPIAQVRAPPTSRPLWLFQAGRLVGYSLAGAAAAQAVQSFAWLTSQTAALRPAWMSGAGRTVWSRIRPWAGTHGGIFTAGALWAFMPCGLLYSALLVASLSGGPLDGALSMALFAIGSAVSLGLAPKLLERLQRSGDKIRKDWGTRASGLLLAAAAAWALWMDLAHRIAVWCGLA